MIEVRQTTVFREWFSELRDRQAQARIVVRIRRVSLGNFGDAKSLGGGLQELKVDHGPGYRIYFVRREAVVVILLCGGDKGSQARDIARARALIDQED